MSRTRAEFFSSIFKRAGSSSLVFGSLTPLVASLLLLLDVSSPSNRFLSSFQFWILYIQYWLFTFIEHVSFLSWIGLSLFIWIEQIFFLEPPLILTCSWAKSAHLIPRTFSVATFHFSTLKNIRSFLFQV